MYTELSRFVTDTEALSKQLKASCRLVDITGRAVQNGQGREDRKPMRSDLVNTK